MELPSYPLLENICVKAKKKINDKYYETIYNRLNSSEIKNIKENVLVYLSGKQTGWAKLKEEPGNITPNNIQVAIKHIKWLKKINIRRSIFQDFPEIKLISLYHESIHQVYSKLIRFSVKKKFAIAAIAIQRSSYQYMDDMIDIFIKSMSALELASKKDYEYHKNQRINTATLLIGRFRDVLSIYKSNQAKQVKYSKLDTVIGKDTEELLEQCADFNAHEYLGHLYFLGKRYKNQQTIFSSFLHLISPKSISGTSPIPDAISFLNQISKKQKNTNKEDLVSDNSNDFDISWIKGKWKKLITKNKVFSISDFELLVAMRLTEGLKSRELFVRDTYKYSDFRAKLISWKEYENKAPAYCASLSLPRCPQQYMQQVKASLRDSCEDAEMSIYTKGKASIKNGRLKISKFKTENHRKDIEEVSSEINQRIAPISLLDIIGKVCKSLNLSEYFKPLESRYSSTEHLKQIVATLFCYGCNIDASEGEKSIVDINRRSINWINASHISEDSLDRCSSHIVNIYNMFQLPQFWGDGKHVSVDGTKWDVYSKNLLAQYHVRYLGYGGIAYYHVSDKYIALFSNFISCGVHEGKYLLDGLEENKSNLKPEYVHGDSHAQSLVIFGLASLLGIKIMPRIRHINDLAYYKADKSDSYGDLDFLFKARTINWKIIRDYYHEMLRVALSIREGRVKASDILSRISARAAQNKLYTAFRELGRAIRTSFLMSYIGNYDLRKMINAATCKSEEFNEYVNWIAFADDKIKQNNRLQQKKFIKYNQLVTNMVLLYNVQAMSIAIDSIREEGIEIDTKLLKSLSPYRKSHITRLGVYELDVANYEDLRFPELSLA